MLRDHLKGHLSASMPDGMGSRLAPEHALRILTLYGTHNGK